MRNKQLTLHRSERLKSRKAIDALFLEGKKISLPPFRIFYSFAGSGLKFGAGVSKKKFRRAVDRNKVKRLIREVYRIQNQSLKSLIAEKSTGLDIFFLYTAEQIPVFDELVIKMAAAIKKLIIVSNESNAQAS